MVMVAAYAVAKASLPAYAHRFSPKKFTQHQLFACLVLKSMLDLDYRSVAALLQDCGDLCRSIDLDRPPHFTTLQKAADRLLRQPFARRLHDETIHLAERRRILKRTIRLAAIDSSGFEARHTSRYFIRRRERGEKTRTNPLYQTTTYRRFPKASIVVDADSHLILAWTVTQGPSSDLVRFADLIHEACRRRTLRAAVLDAGYDAEWMHRYLRLDLGVRSIIPPKIGRPTTRAPTGHFRALMHHSFPTALYGQRWQAETVFSMIKRRQGDAVNAIHRHAQARALTLKVLTHNIMIIKRHRGGFLQSKYEAFMCFAAALRPSPWKVPELSSSPATQGSRGLRSSMGRSTKKRARYRA